MSDGNETNELKAKAHALGLTSDELDQVLAANGKNVEETTVILALVYLKLAPKVGFDSDAISHWIHTQNYYFGTSPLELLSKEGKFRDVVAYLHTLDR